MAAIMPEMVLKKMWGTSSHQLTKQEGDTVWYLRFLYFCFWFYSMFVYLIRPKHNLLYRNFVYYIIKKTRCQLNCQTFNKNLLNKIKFDKMRKKLR